jgi:outer membrane lipoprotein LolB
MTRGRAAALLAAATLSSACATLPVGTDGLSYSERRSTLESVDAWEMRGRLAVDTADGGFQGSFNWRQQADTLDLTVRGPLGNGVLQVTGTPNALQVTARGETRRLEDPETDISALLGWWLPVASLPKWLLGLPDEEFGAATEPGADGTLAAIDQRLWRVAYPTYQLAPLADTASGVLIPRRIDLEHGELKLRLTLDRWQPTALATSP